ncbi:hypothetical protein AGRO_2983 [Agrobacterium sp. ATCC 31749]|nr:hypothetical protein AGRO_2983 [Agrobacterium sp. ATCC 31749]
MALLISSNSALSVECGMTIGWEYRDEETQRPLSSIYKADSRIPSIFYTADMDINTDGSPRSYHPNDPKGETIALNNMGNAINSIHEKFGGKSLGCRPRRGECYERYISTFEAARDSNYDRLAPWITTDGMIPWKYDAKLKRHIPCLVESGSYKGYFVSQTSVRLKNGDECDPSIYLDSMKINANVLPRNTHWESQGIVTDGFDLVVVINASNKIVFGINGDRGPSIGEVSVALGASMAGVKLKGDETYRQVKKLALANASYLIFPAIDLKRLKGPGFSQSDIDEIGAKTFREWGGLDRLIRCRGTLPVRAKQ